MGRDATGDAGAGARGDAPTGAPGRGGSDGEVRERDAERRLLGALRARGLVRGDESAFGRPLARVEPGHEPQALADASPQQRQVATLAYAVGWPGEGLCATWVERVVQAAGLGFYPGDARAVYGRDCHLSDPALLKVAMVVAVPTAPFSAAARAHGHVGVYVGDGLVRDCVEQGVRTVPLSLWLLAYGLMAEPRWGWAASIPLG